MFTSATPPPRLVKLSCIELTDPVDVRVVDVAYRVEPRIPNRVSLPSIAPPASCGAVPEPASSAQVMSDSDTTNSTAIVPTMAMPCRLSPTMRPKARGIEKGITRNSSTSTMLVQAVGFSNGCAELALKNPPPLVPRSLIASCEATGPPGTTAVPPVTVVTSWNPAKFWMTPPASSTTAPTIDSGSRMRSVPRVRSTQKLPMVPEERYAKPRMRATATAIPTAADRKFCTAKPTSCTV